MDTEHVRTLYGRDLRMSIVSDVDGALQLEYQMIIRDIVFDMI